MLKVTYSCGHEGHFPSWIPDGLEKLEDEGEIARALMVNGLIKATYQCAVCDLNHRPPSSASPLEWLEQEVINKKLNTLNVIAGLNPNEWSAKQIIGMAQSVQMPADRAAKPEPAKCSECGGSGSIKCSCGAGNHRVDHIQGCAVERCLNCLGTGRKL